jgi:hypothetical protein
MATNGNKLSSKKFQYICEYCNKEYVDRTGLWRHKKKCSMIQGHNDGQKHSIASEMDKELLVTMLLKNQDVIEKMMEIIPSVGANNSYNTNSNNTNNFNIQMFLNEHCKNAMNITDFIQSLPITNKTYDDTIENGLTNAITNIMVNGLCELDVLKRPIHCTDPARKTMYIKDNNVWERDNELKLLLDGIKTLSVKQRTSLCKWQDANNGWDKDENLQTKMTTLVMRSMSNVESDEKEVNKIIRAISKNVYLDNDTKKQFS